MDNKKTPYITDFLRQFSITFSLTVLVFSLAGKIISSIDVEMNNLTTILTYDGTGLPYNTISQLFGFSIIMAFAAKFVFSDLFAIKLLFILRYILFMFITLFSTIIFSFVFNWFPMNIFQAWLIFIPAFIISNAIAIGVSILLLKLEDKRYNNLLKEFKNMQKNDI